MNSSTLGDNLEDAQAGNDSLSGKPRHLSSKSRQIYLEEYKNFLQWATNKRCTIISENVVLAYFKDLSKKFKPSSLWNKYSKLKKTLLWKHNIRMGEYQTVLTYMKRTNKGYQSKKSKVLTAQDVEKFLNEAPDDKYLATKVALILGISGALRREELTHLLIDNIEEQGETLLVHIPSTKNKDPRSFKIHGHFYHIVKKYISLRTPKFKSQRFFQNFQNGKCTAQCIGINKIAQMPKDIATYLRLPEPEAYTGHCFKRTSASLLANSGADLASIMRHDWWKYSMGAENDVENEIICNKITRSSNAMEPLPSTSIYTDPTELRPATMAGNTGLNDDPAVDHLYNLDEPDHHEFDQDDLEEDSDAETQDANLDSLPSKSRDKYLEEYKNFLKWKTKNKYASFSEKVIFAYFEHLSSKYKPNSLWAKYSMLKSTLRLKNNICIENYKRLILFLKNEQKGFQPKKSKALTAQDVEKFLDEAPDDKYLATKVALIFGIKGGLIREELSNILINDIEEHGETMIVHIRNDNTKRPRMFTIHGQQFWIVKKYMSLRNPNLDSPRFFQNFQNGKCFAQFIGLNKFGRMPKEIATYLNLPEPEAYTGHCYKKTSASLLANSGADLTSIIRLDEWKSNTMAENHSENDVEHEKDICNNIMEASPSTSLDTDSMALQPATLTGNTGLIDFEFDEDDLVEESEALAEEVAPPLLSDEENDLLNPDLKRAKATNFDSLPSRSRDKYLEEYKIFLEWKTSKKFASFSEKVLMAYFKYLASKYKPTSLWSKYSMLKSTLRYKNNVCIDKYKTLTSFIKRVNHGYRSKKSKVLTAYDVEQFLDKAPDDKYLATKVALIFGITGGLRPGELINILIDDIEEHGETMLVRIPKGKVPRSFTIHGQFYFWMVKKYVSLRNPKQQSRRFFQNFQNGRCTAQFVGRNKFARMAKEIATYLRLPDPKAYTGHCFKKTSDSLLANTGADLTTITRHGGWKSNSVAENYSENCVESEKDMYNKELNDDPAVDPLVDLDESDDHEFDEDDLDEDDLDEDSDAQNQDATEIVISSEDENDSPDIMDDAQAANLDSLPSRSRDKYLEEYKCLLAWKKNKKYASFSEKVLLAYFKNLSPKYKPSTLWSKYSMLKSTLRLKNNVCIYKYQRLIAFLKRKTKRFRPKKLKALTAQNVEKFLDEAPDDKYLATKVALIFGISGGLRQNEIIKILIDDIEEHGEILLVHIPNEKSKIPRTFTIHGRFYHIVKKYKSLRNSKVESRRFFQSFQYGKCTTQCIGKNKFGQMPKEIATYLRLPDPDAYKGFSFRRTTASLLANSRAVLTEKRYTGRESSPVAGNIEISVENEKEICNKSMKMELCPPTSYPTELPPATLTGNQKFEDTGLNDDPALDHLVNLDESDRHEFDEDDPEEDWDAQNQDASAEVVQEANLDSLPSKSRHKYLEELRHFLEWKTKNKCTSFSEKVLLAYFKHLSTSYKPSSLWSKYSMLKSTLQVKNNVRIDEYQTLIAFLKQKNYRFKSKKSHVLTAQNVEQFLDQAPDDKYLATKVALIFGISGALYMEELMNISIDDIEEHGDTLLVHIPNEKNKMPRSITIRGRFYQIVKKYESLRTPELTSRRFFQKFEYGECTAQCLGKRQFGLMPKEIAAYLRLPEPEAYTGHCFRRTAASLRANAGTDVTITVKRQGGQKSGSVAENYIEASVGNEKEISIKMEPCPSTSFDVDPTELQLTLTGNQKYEDIELNDDPAVDPLVNMDESDHHEFDEEYLEEDSDAQNQDATEEVAPSSSSEDEDVPLDILKDAQAINEESLPTKSRNRYLEEYNHFLEWKTKKKCASFSENVLLAYFKYLSTKYKPSTLWVKYSMLKSTISLKNNVDIEFRALLAFLRRKNVGYRSKKSKVLTPQNVVEFLDEAPDDKYLAMKVALIFGVTGALALEELVKIRIDDIEEHGETMLVHFRNAKSKMPRSITIHGRFYHIVKKYASLRSPKMESKRFFQKFQNGKCAAQVIGRNKFGQVPKEIAKYLRLPEPEEYTGHCFKRTASLLANCGAEEIEKRYGGRKSSPVAENYAEISVENEKEICNKSIKMEPCPPTSFDTGPTELQPATLNGKQKFEDTGLNDDQAVDPLVNMDESDHHESDEEYLEADSDAQNQDATEEMAPSSSSEDEDVPLDILKDAQAINEESLPMKSRNKYLEEYNQFLVWKTKRKCASFSSNVLLAYFKYLSTKYKPSTLWAKYSMLKSTISLKNNVDIEFHALLAFLRRKNDGYRSKKSKVLTANDVENFLNKAPDHKYLATKVALIFGITGALRRKDLTTILIDDIEDHGETLQVNVPKGSVPRSFTIPKQFYHIVKKYESLRSSESESRRFFQNFQNGKCTTQCIGINKFGQMPKEIATYLRLPDAEAYTGHCFKRSSAPVLANMGGDLTNSNSDIENSSDDKKEVDTHKPVVCIPKDKSVQVSIICHKRSKSTQTKSNFRNKAVSAMTTTTNDAELNSDDDDESFQIHLDVPGDKPLLCASCSKHISGAYFSCVQCPLILCRACEAKDVHAAHYLLRVPAGWTQSEAQKVQTKVKKKLTAAIVKAQPKTTAKKPIAKAKTTATKIGKPATVTSKAVGKKAAQSSDSDSDEERGPAEERCEVLVKMEPEDCADPIDTRGGYNTLTSELDIKAEQVKVEIEELPPARWASSEPGAQVTALETDFAVASISGCISPAPEQAASPAVALAQPSMVVLAPSSVVLAPTSVVLAPPKYVLTRPPLVAMPKKPVRLQPKESPKPKSSAAKETAKSQASSSSFQVFSHKPSAPRKSTGDGNAGNQGKRPSTDPGSVGKKTKLDEKDS